MLIRRVFRSPESLVMIVSLVASAFLFPGQSSGHSHSISILSAEQLSPENTVILANRIDTRFSQDFSTLLKQLCLQWVTVDSPTVPDSTKDKNVIILGRLDAAYTGEIMRTVMTTEEIETVQAATDRHTVLVKDSPWMDGKSIFICTGTDLILTRNAAEEAVRSIIASSPPASTWIQTMFEATLDEDSREYVDQLRFMWDDAELPLADLMMDVTAKPRQYISTQEAVEDAEHLFHLLSHGYAGYAFFNQNGEFEQAKTHIMEELSSGSEWSAGDFSRLLYEHLSFITDDHLRIGDPEYEYAEHTDFWYDTTLELVLGTEGYQFTDGGTRYTVISVNDEAPEPFVFPSLNSQGEPTYRLGTLSKKEPGPLLLVAANDEEDRHFEIELQRSHFAYYSDDIFREDNIGGIPVIRVRSFFDPHADALNDFVKTASAHKGEPVIVVDIRGNDGGNEAWPIRWIQGLTGRRAESVFIFSELHSKTTMAGRANTHAYLYDLYPSTDDFREEMDRFTNLAEGFDSGMYEPYWVGPYYPEIPLIANDTTIIIVMNGRVGSAGEGFVTRASQLANVVLIGENSAGCLTFGNVSHHQLPHSRLMVRLPINFGLFQDMEFREEKGIAPDLWVPAADAVNYAVAAVRSGTITTYQPLSPTTWQQEFIPEDPWARDQQGRMIRVLLIALLTAAGSVLAYFMRKKARSVVVVGVIWIIVGSVWLYMEQPVGFGLLFGGVICLVWGGISLWRARRAAASTVE